MFALAISAGAWISPTQAVAPAQPPPVFKPLTVPTAPLTVRPVEPERELRQVPSVIGMTEAQARNVLERAGFATGGIRRVASAAAAGTVVSQSVAPGTRHDPRQPVDLEISLGRKPEIKVFKPPVIDPDAFKGLITPQPPPEWPPPRDDVQPESKPEIKVFKPPVISPDLFKGLVTPPARPTQPERPTQPPAGDDVQPQFIVVPQLLEANLAQARARLDLRRLKLGRVERRAHEAPAGIVIDQSPAAGTQLARPVAVDVVVSTGPELITVPNVVGLQLDEARERLAPLSRGQVSAEWIASDRTRGLVLRQSPRAGSRIKPSPPPAFRLHVSAGPRRVVPDVVGRMLADAQRILGGADLQVRAIRETESDVPAGRVIDQRPKGGTDIAANRIEAVDLLVSRGPAEIVEIEVPNVIGRGEKVARAQIGEAGLAVGAVDREHTAEPAGIVVGQTPRGGTRLRRDERRPVDLRVSLGPAAVAQTMPNLVGEPLDAVPLLLAPVELSIAAVRAQASIEPKGTVVAQQPAAGAPVKPGGRVNVTVSDGSRVRVPALVGRSREQAAQLLRGADLNARESTREAQQGHGTVLEQSPQAGAEVTRGSFVQMVVAAPPQREPPVTVPDVIGVPITPARQSIEAAGLAVATQEADSSGYEAGTVAAQSPAGGTEAVRQSTVQLTISLGPPPLPDLVGMPVSHARGRLVQLGLAASVSERRADDQPRDVVLAQKPAAGARLPRGAEVALVVAIGPPGGATVTPTPPAPPTIPPAVLFAGAAGGALVLAGAGAMLARRIRGSRKAEKPAAKRGVIDAKVRLDAAGRMTELMSTPAVEQPDVHFRIRLEHGETRLQQEGGDRP